MYKRQGLKEGSLGYTDPILGTRVRNVGENERIVGFEERNLGNDLRNVAGKECNFGNAECNLGNDLGNVGGKERNFGNAECNLDNKLPTEEMDPQHHINQFQEYVEMADATYRSFDRKTEASIELMSLMNEKGGSVSLYEEVRKWHTKNIEAKVLVEANKLRKDLKERYNLKPLEPYERVIKELPFSKERVHIEPILH